jgi:hypothetical protein
MIASGAKRISIDVKHGGAPDRCNLDAYTLHLSGHDAVGVAISIPEETFATEQVEGWLLGSGLYYTGMRAGFGHGFEVAASSAGHLAGTSLRIVLFVAAAAEVRAALLKLAAEQYPDVVLHVDAAHDLNAAPPSGSTVVIEASCMTDLGVAERLRQFEAPNIILVCRDVGALPLSAVFAWDDDPLIVAGTLDASALQAVLEGALQRHLAAKRRAPTVPKSSLRPICLQPTPRRPRRLSQPVTLQKMPRSRRLKAKPSRVKPVPSKPKVAPSSFQILMASASIQTWRRQRTAVVRVTPYPSTT